ncbi:unnamed protein product, partial [Adineta steineri]
MEVRYVQCFSWQPLGPIRINVSLDLNDYVEVEFHQTQTYIPSMDYLSFGECKPMRLLPKLIDDSQNQDLQKSSIVLKRDCNVDVDP